MDRNAIHHQITTLAEKISHLNHVLLKEGILHPVEMELLRGYAKELLGMVEQLSTVKSDLMVKKEMKEENVSFSSFEEKEPATEPVEMEREEIKLHQRILGRVEEAMTAKSTEPAMKVEPEKQPEGILISKKLMAGAVAGNDQRAISLNERFKKETTAISDKLKGSQKKNFKELFELNERYKYIEDLFGGSSEQFNKAMHDLSKISARGEAESYFKTIEIKYSWSKKQALASRFTEKVLEFLG